MTTSAYNLGNSGLASKILRTKDLMRAVEGFRFGNGRCGGVVFGIRRRELLGELLGMSQFGLWRFLSKGWMSQGGVWKAVEKNWSEGQNPHPNPAKGQLD